MPSLFGDSGKFKQLSTQTGQQQNLFAQMLAGLGGAQGMGLDYLMELLSGSPEAMARFEAPIKRQFEQEIVPGIAERFAGAGTHGAQSSSAMDLSMAQAGRELSENLGALRGNLQQNAMQQLMGMLGMGYQPTFENVYQQPTEGILPQLFSAGAQGLGNYYGMKAAGNALSKSLNV